MLLIMRNLCRNIVVGSGVSSTSFIIYYLSLIIYYLIVPVAPVTAQPLMRDVFAAMPDSVLPMVTKNNRLDCIDFIENNMEARVRNKVDEYVTLEALTPDYARFRTSAVAVLEMKLLPARVSATAPAPSPADSSASSPFILCVVTTVQVGEENTSRRLEDSTIRFYHTDWMPLNNIVFSAPSLEAYFTTMSPETDAARRALGSFSPIKLQLSPEHNTLTATMQTAALSADEREAIREVLKPIVMQWNGESFVQE